ncbi:MAG TPA: hypothetical protein VII06_04095 [Chloroflexota bacterium]|jgi:hypothetical protein
MVVTNRVREVYERHVRPLSEAERLQLLALVAEQLADEAGPPAEEPLHDIMEFHGAGRDSWDGTDAQEYVKKLRGGWDDQP